MNIEETKIGETRVISPDGHLDAQTEEQFQYSVMKNIHDGETSILLDFSKLEYISSAGLRAILIVAKQQKETGGKLGVSGLQPNVAEVFSVSGFDKIVDVYSDLNAGLEGVS